MTVQDEIRQRIEKDVLLARLRRKIDTGKADFNDTFLYSDRAGKLLGEIFSRRLPDIPLEEREALCVELLRDRYTDINQLIDRVQRVLDEAQNLHIAPQHAPFKNERAHKIGNATADPTVPVETQQRRAESAPATMTRAMHDDRMKKEADFRSRAGLQCYITRKTDGKCCEWCDKMAGRYEYHSEPKDIYRRHDNCGCSVTYENGRKRQDVWSKREWEAPEPGAGAGDPVVFTKEQAAAAGAGDVRVFTPEEAAAASSKNSLQILTSDTKYATIESADSRDYYAARRFFNAMTAEQRAEVVMKGIQAPDPTFSYDKPGTYAMSWLRKVKPEPNMFDVRAHGTPIGIEFFRQDYPDGDPRSFIDAYTLATILRGREDFQNFIADCLDRGVKPSVRLMACSTGDTTNTGNCFAQLLANELGMNVSAPTDLLYPRFNGTFYIGDYGEGFLKPFWARK